MDSKKRTSKTAILVLTAGVVAFAGSGSVVGDSRAETVAGADPTETTTRGTLPAGSLTSSLSSRAVRTPISSVLFFYGDIFVGRELTNGVSDRRCRRRRNL